MMACNSCPVTNATTLRDLHEAGRRLHRSFSSKDLHKRGGLRQSYSDNHLCRSTGGIRASVLQPKLKNSPSLDLFNIQLTLRSLLFDQGMDREIGIEENLEESDQEDVFEINNGKKRANWIERLMELRNSWKEKQQEKDEENISGETEGCNEEGGCQVEYEEDAEGRDISVDRETFLLLLRNVSWSDTKLFSQLAFLCNMAYVIPDIKTGDLRRYYGLEFVTSSLEKKAAAATIRDKVEQDSIRVPRDAALESAENPEPKPRLQPSAAHGIAPSAASYVQWHAKDLIEPQRSADGLFVTPEYNNQIDKYEGSSARIYKSEMAACVAASTMTTVVAAGEKQKEKAARELQSLQSSPCEWFVCDDLSIHTRCFVIQGSDSLASWQANLFFEPTKFEGTDVLVHRGIYEAAKGIYNQFMPEIKQHLYRFGDRAKLQFTGHSLGGSLALLVNLMLLTRKQVKKSALLPVVTFGSPFVFCGGQKLLDQLNLDEEHVHSVMMHRDIVPRAFSCKYPNYVAKVLKRLNSSFHFHPCLNKNVSTLALCILAVIQRLTSNFQVHPYLNNKNKLLYSPMGKVFILQPDEKSSPPHPLLPPGTGLYALDSSQISISRSGLRAFLNSPHPIETLSDPTAYGSEGTIIRDHDSSNYLKAVNKVIRRNKRLAIRKARKERNHMWPLLSSRSPHAWSNTCYGIENRQEVTTKVLNGVKDFSNICS